MKLIILGTKSYKHKYLHPSRSDMKKSHVHFFNFADFFITLSLSWIGSASRVFPSHTRVLDLKSITKVPMWAWTDTIEGEPRYF